MISRVWPWCQVAETPCICSTQHVAQGFPWPMCYMPWDVPGIWAKYSEGDIGIADAKVVLEEYAGLRRSKVGWLCAPAAGFWEWFLISFKLCPCLGQYLLVWAKTAIGDELTCKQCGRSMVQPLITLQPFLIQWCKWTHQFYIQTTT